MKIYQVPERVSCVVSDGEAFEASIGRITASGCFIAAPPQRLSYTDSVKVTFHTQTEPKLSFRGCVATWVRNRGFRVEALSDTPKEILRALTAWSKGEPAQLEGTGVPTQELYVGAQPTTPDWRTNSQITEISKIPGALADTFEDEEQDDFSDLSLDSEDLETGALGLAGIPLSTGDIIPIEEEPVFDPWKDPNEALTPRGLNGTRVLVIDDDPGVLKMLERLLTRQGCHVTTTSNPPHGLALLDQAQVDAVLLDWMLPVIPGQQMLKVIKSCNANLPVAVISGMLFQDNTLADIQRMGASRIITKPLNVEALTGWLSTVA